MSLNPILPHTLAQPSGHPKTGQFHDRSVQNPPQPHPAPSAGRAHHPFADENAQNIFQQTLKTENPQPSSRNSEIRSSQPIIEKYSQAWSAAVTNANQVLERAGEPTYPEEPITIRSKTNDQTYLDPRFLMFNGQFMADDEKSVLLRDLEHMVTDANCSDDQAWQAAFTYYLHTEDPKKQISIIENFITAVGTDETNQEQITAAKQALEEGNPLDALKHLASSENKRFIIENSDYLPSLAHTNDEKENAIESFCQTLSTENPHLTRLNTLLEPEFTILDSDDLKKEDESEIIIGKQPIPDDINSITLSPQQKPKPRSFFTELLSLPFEALINIPGIGNKIAVLLPKSIIQLALYHTLNASFDTISADDPRRIKAETILKRKSAKLVNDAFMDTEDFFPKIQSLLKPPTSLSKTYTLKALLQASSEGHLNQETPAYAFLREDRLNKEQKQQLFALIGEHIPPKTDNEPAEITQLRTSILTLLMERMMTAKTDIHRTSVESNTIFWSTPSITAHKDELTAIIKDFAFKVNTSIGKERFIQNEGFGMALGQVLQSADETERKALIESMADTLIHPSTRIDQGYGILRALHYALPKDQQHLSVDSFPGGNSTQLRQAIRRKLLAIDPTTEAPIYSNTLQNQILYRLGQWGTDIKLYPSQPQSSSQSNPTHTFNETPILPTPLPHTFEHDFSSPPQYDSFYNNPMPDFAQIENLDSQTNKAAGLLRSAAQPGPYLASSRTESIQQQLNHTGQSLEDFYPLIASVTFETPKKQLESLLGAAKGFGTATTDLIDLLRTHHDTLYDGYLDNLEKSTKHLETSIEVLNNSVDSIMDNPSLLNVKNHYQQTLKCLEIVAHNTATPLALGQTPIDWADTPPEQWSVQQRIAFFQNKPIMGVPKPKGSY